MRQHEAAALMEMLGIQVGSLEEESVHRFSALVDLMGAFYAYDRQNDTPEGRALGRELAEEWLVG